MAPDKPLPPGLAAALHRLDDPAQPFEAPPGLETLPVAVERGAVRLRHPGRGGGVGARVLVAGVGNVLRRDDGFGVVVAQRLVAEGSLPAGVDVIETGIGGLSIVQQLMDGYQSLIVVDVVDQGAAPGTVFLVQPRVADPATLPADEVRALFSDLHLAEPSRVFLLARALGVLPKRVLIVGCQPEDCDELSTELSAPVAAAVDVAVRRIRELVLPAVEQPA